jgi:hypothetical protein
MTQDLLKDGEEGHFFRGNLHCHSNRSDGLAEPAEVVAAYREAGYDFLCLSDHFEQEHGWRITDTRPFQDEDFAMILGAELSSAPWDERACYWVTAAGLPQDFAPPPPDDQAEAIRRAANLGTFVVMLHPGLNNLPLEAVDGLPGLDAVHAVEIYNHNCAMAALPDRAYGVYMLDGLLEGGRRLLVNAGDDARRREGVETTAQAVDQLGRRNGRKRSVSHRRRRRARQDSNLRPSDFTIGTLLTSLFGQFRRARL